MDQKLYIINNYIYKKKYIDIISPQIINLKIIKKLLKINLYL